MVEHPEKKVLMKALEKLKTKTLTSLSLFQIKYKGTQGMFENAHKRLNELHSELKGKDQKKVKAILELLEVFNLDVVNLIISSLGVVTDMQTYIDVLESYSSELDKTLTEIFEGAKKLAEDEIKQQEELMKKGDTSYIK